VWKSRELVVRQVKLRNVGEGGTDVIWEITDLAVAQVEDLK